MPGDYMNMFEIPGCCSFCLKHARLQQCGDCRSRDGLALQRPWQRAFSTASRVIVCNSADSCDDDQAVAKSGLQLGFQEVYDRKAQGNLVLSILQIRILTPSKKVHIVKHPCIGEYAIDFITFNVILWTSTGKEEVFCIYVPTDHLYLRDTLLINSKDVIRPNLSVREGIGIRN
ncbi:hypothetical protein MLD38_001796 [Melastoma candidum]|uniref:Uncharacterized protein n=1 Tax=Melastoma candidum TaxID=119954 RepID=A0ACB9SJA1_9MYRT|nr:hypothetical protein MLD38_001796 [Melastoma candidum]